MATLNEILTEAVADLTENGFTSDERIAYWQEQLRGAMDAMLLSEDHLEDMLRQTLRSVYQREVERDGLLKRHPGLSKFTLQQIKPKLHDELSKRIMASANLIKLNRDEAIEKTLRRFSGWATSIPDGGSKTVDRVETKAEIRKAFSSLPYTERRVAIDQGHKLVAAVNEIVAMDGGAIAAIWHSHWMERGYVNYRVEHKKLDLKTFLIRGSWAQKMGWVKPDENGYTDQVDQPGTPVFCRCYWQFLYNIAQLPDSMVTAKARVALAEARAKREKLLRPVGAGV
jgi:hypothetical protein